LIPLVLVGLVGLVVIAAALRRTSESEYELPAGATGDLPLLTPTRIASAPESGRVACTGVVREIPAARLPGTLEGSPAVWVEGLVEAAECDELGVVIRRWPILAFVDAVPFWLDDGSGVRALVLPDRGRLLPSLGESLMRRVDGDATARVLDLLVRYNKAVDARTPLFFGEISVGAGEVVTVQAAVHWNEGDASYRQAAQRSLVLTSGDAALVLRRARTT
jgi:hypothetical protein